MIFILQHMQQSQTFIPKIPTISFPINLPQSFQNQGRQFIVQLNIMSGATLQYTIVNKNIIKTKSGKVDSICNKNSESGFLVLIKDKFQMSIRLKCQGIVQMAEVKNWNSGAIRFIFYHNKNMLSQFYHVFQNPSSAAILFFEEINSKKLTINKIDIELDILYTMQEKLIGLKYLKFNGIRMQSDVKEQKIINKYMIPEGDQYRLQDKKGRNKQKSIEFERKTKRQKNRSQQQQEISNVEEMQMKEVMKQSLKQQEMSKQMTKRIKKESKKEEIYKDFVEETYVKIDFQKYKDVFANVNVKWLQSQRKVELQKKVQSNYRLSNHIKVKHLMGKKIIIDARSQERKLQLQKIALELGAKILAQPVDDCILVTQKINSQKIDKAKKCKRAKIVKALFLQECKKQNTELNVGDYFIKL